MLTPGNQAPPAGLTANDPFVSAHTRAMVVVALFVAYIVVAVSGVIAKVMELVLPPLVLAAAEGDGEQLTLGDLIQFLVGVATLFVFISLVIAFLVWLHRVAKNLPALGNPKSRIEYTPGWAVGFFFIPLANLFLPYRAVREIWLKSDPSVRTEDDLVLVPSSGPPLLLGWWIMWVAANILGRASWRAESTLSGMKNFVGFVDLLSDLSAIAAAALGIMVVRGIDRRQAARALHVAYVNNMPPPPPIFRPPNLNQS